MCFFVAALYVDKIFRLKELDEHFHSFDFEDTLCIIDIPRVIYKPKEKNVYVFVK